MGKQEDINHPEKCMLKQIKIESVRTDAVLLCSLEKKENLLKAIPILSSAKVCEIPSSFMLVMNSHSL